MKNHKRITIVLLVLSMILTLSACNTDTTSQSNQTTKATSAGQTTSATKSPEIVMNLWLNRVANLAATGNTYKKTLEKVKQDTGVTLNVQYWDWGETYNQKMNMYAASGDLPSGVWMFAEPVKNTFNLTTLNTMGEAGMLRTWDKYIKDPSMKTLVTNASEDFITMTKATDGKQYLYPCNIHREFPHAPGGITIRKDWLVQCGLSYPKNQDEFYKMIVTFKEKIKDVNGKPVIPVSLCGFDDPVQEYVMRFWLNSWMGTGLWYKNSAGGFDFARYAKIDELTMALKFLNKLWREDLFDKEAFSQKSDQFIEKCVNGQIGVCGYSYVATYKASDTLIAKNPDTYFVAAPSFSCNPNLPVEKVNSCEIIAVPMSCVVVTTKGVTDQQMDAYAKVVDSIGIYENNMTYVLGFEGDTWKKDAQGNVSYTQDYLDKRTKIENYSAIEGIGLIGSLNTNSKVMSTMLKLVVTQKDRLESVKNISGHQLAITDPINVVIPGPIEQEKQPMIEQAWLQMVIKAVSANSEADCQAAISAWPTTRDSLGYKAWVTERTSIASKALGK